MKLRIVSPEKVVYDGEAQSVVVPGTLGSFEILVNHSPIISSLEDGEVSYTVGGEKRTLQITGGFVEVQKNVVSLCVELNSLTSK